MIISLIAAVSKNNVIGVDGDLPWSLPADMKFFSKTTRGHHVLMGRKNFDSIPDRFRPLPSRPNIVVTRNGSFTAEGVIVCNSIEAGIAHAEQAGEEELFIIGGGDIYKQCLSIADRLYITHVNTVIEGDAFFPAFDPSDWEQEVLIEHPIDDVHNFSFEVCLYRKK
jgi:dihydrofolate reductase